MVNIKLEIDQNISGCDLELLYSKEKDPKVKERLLMLIHTKEGKNTREVAKIVRKSHVSVAHWINRFNEEGIEGLKDRKRSGKPPKMNKDQFESLKEDLDKSPREFNYKRDFWTTKLVRIHILQHYITRYTNRHVQRLLHKFGFSLIKPRPRHTKRDLSKKEEFTEILKKTRRVWTRMDSSNNG